MLPGNKAVAKRCEILTKKMTWQQDSSPISHYASSPVFNLPFLEPPTTITKRFHVTEMPERRDPLLTLSTYTNEAREEYRQRT
jgi:hypothetical protein